MPDPILSSGIPSGSSISQTMFRQGVTHQAERQFLIRDLVGTGEFDGIQLQEEIKTGGDTIRMMFSPTEDQDGFSDTAQIEGNEADVKFFFEDMKIGYNAFAFKQSGPMNQQRSQANIRSTIMKKHPILWKRYWERVILWQLAGFTPANTTAGLLAAKNAGLTGGATLTNDDGTYRHSGLNPIVAVDEAHRVYATGSSAANVGADTSAKLSLRLIDRLETKAMSSGESLDYPILPCRDGYYYLVITPKGREQLRANTSAGDWQDITRAKLEGGERWQDNEIYRGHVGMYSKTIIVVSDYVPPAPATADAAAIEDGTTCGIFIGAKAGCMAFGDGYHGGEHIDYVEQIRDYRRYGVATESVWGFKRTTFPNKAGTSQTYGSMLLVYNDATPS